MCGIAGLLDLSGRFDRQTMSDLAKRMADSLAHRGPDDAGVWVDPSGFCALSHRRLSIVDLSPGGHEPMIHTSGSAVTFNGEIYNYRALREELIAKGHTFHTESDTEVLLAGLAEEGAHIVNKLDAMFAFAWFDPRRKTLILARDPFGEKPLYYAFTKDWFAFASELQALTLLPDFDAAIDHHRIASYLALQYVPAPLSIYKNAHKLPPGHILSLTAGKSLSIERYFHFSAQPHASKASLDQLVDELEDILSTTVRSRLMSDVPLGAFLSSGVDSPTVVALAMRHVKTPIKTFSIGFTDGDDSEHAEARAIAAHLGTDHHEEILSADAFSIRHEIPRILDEPNADSSCMPLWMIARLARRDVTVALSGDGGDELFGGYGRYQAILQQGAAQKPGWSAGDAYYSAAIMIFPDASLEKFIGPLPAETKTLLHEMRAPLDRADKDLLHRLRETDVENYLPGAVLAKVDRMSMRHSLEVRAPLLGRRVADFAMRMMAANLCTPDTSKRVLKHLAARYLPRAWLERPKKGFGIPTTASWGGKIMADEIATLLTGPDCRLAAWFPPENLKRFAAYHKKTPVNAHMWAVFVLEQWLRHHPGRPC